MTDANGGVRPVTDTPAAPVLSYAGDLPARYGISHEVHGRVARIVVPSSRRFRYLAAELMAPAVLLLYAAGGLVTLLRALLATEPQARPPGVGDMVFNGVLAATFGAAAWVGVREWLRQTRRRTVFELDEHALVVHDHVPAGKPRQRSWPRGSVGDVRPGPVPWNAPPGRGRGLHVRITGRTIVEVMPGHDPAVAAWVAERLNAALTAAGPDPALGG